MFLTVWSQITSIRFAWGSNKNCSILGPTLHALNENPGGKPRCYIHLEDTLQVVLMAARHLNVSGGNSFRAKGQIMNIQSQGHKRSPIWWQMPMRRVLIPSLGN